MCPAIRSAPLQKKIVKRLKNLEKKKEYKKWWGVGGKKRRKGLFEHKGTLKVSQLWLMLEESQVGGRNEGGRIG